MNPILQLSKIHRTFGDRYILKGVDLSLQPNEAIAIVGHNGAGKTTLLRIISTLLRPTSGDVSIFDDDGEGEKTAIRRRIGLLVAEGFLYNELTVFENLLFYSKLYHLDNGEGLARQWLERFQMTRFRNELARTLSRGERQKIALIRSVIHSPRLILWDEPSTGLDKLSKENFKEVATELKANASIICSTHDLTAVEGWVDRTYTLDGGKLH